MGTHLRRNNCHGPLRQATSPVTSTAHWTFNGVLRNVWDDPGTRQVLFVGQGQAVQEGCVDGRVLSIASRLRLLAADRYLLRISRSSCFSVEDAGALLRNWRSHKRLC